ncbi:hypothetical protein [Hymenobacter baengnokdamensis]|uniref:hypothetical protein n=1 Tax=Hymenobacter baengnokdamensis TaxID=2615203 RepID=UPI0012468CBF|nr:hypothetical protein [Hymenobacter baengnokdamensis]
MTRQDEIDRVYNNKPHVVLLGAGASIAATIRNPEPGGKRLPSMYSIADVVGLQDIIAKLPPHIVDPNFEKLYSTLYDEMPKSPLLEVINHRIYQYFSKMTLPPEPTIYDYLVCSLRTEDVIATFNWDPFLYEAWNRNTEFFTGGKRSSECTQWHESPPNVLFLHGNVRLGYSREDQRAGPVGYSMRADGSGFFEPTQLLYPVTHKDYNSDEFIASQWHILQERLERAARVTIFGYSAPKTDVEAIDLLKSAWGGAELRNMEQFELIDVRPEQEVKASWDGFIHSHHYDYHTNYFDSSLARHPRRTYESYVHMTMPRTIDEAFQDGNPIPRDFTTLQELWDWLGPLKAAEKAFEERE